MSTDWALLTNGGQIAYSQNRGNANTSPYTQPIDGDDATLYQWAIQWINLPTVTIHLAATKTIFGWRVLFPPDTAYATTAEVWYSADNINFTQIYNGAVGGIDWQYACTPTNGRFWKFVFPTGIGTFPRFRTISVFEDEGMAPTPPEGVLESDLFYKIGSRAPEIAAAWTLLQAAPANFEPHLMLALIGLWNNWLLQNLAEGGGGSGQCLYVEPDPNNQALFDRIVALEDQVNLRHDGVDILIGAVAQKIDDLFYAIFGQTAFPGDSLLNRIELGDNAIMNYTYDRMVDTINAVDNAGLVTRTDLRGALNKDHSDLWNGLFDPTWGAIRQINDNTNAAEVAIRNDVDAAEAAILAALATIQADTDDIQETLGTLSIPAALSFRWPGSSGVTFGSAVPVSGATEINAACHGAVVNVVAYPPGQSRQIGGSTLRYKGIGWLAFRSDRGDYEAIEQIHLEDQVIITKQLEQASGMAVYCKPGASLLITPFTIDGV